MDNPIRLHWLDPRNPQQPFPPAHLAMRDPNGLLAIGGDLSPTRLLRAYSLGIFPWYNPDEPILWWCPDPRTVLWPDGLKITRSYRKAIARADYAVTLDLALDAVMDACAGPRARSRGTWLGGDMKQAYATLHREGYCHSVEVWRQGELIGGLYGIALGRVFFGESMFSHADNGSKIALWWLCEQLRAWNFRMIDCQISSAHLLSLGAQDLPRDDFLRLQRPAASEPGRVGLWRFEIAVPDAAAHLPPGLSP